MMTKNIPADIQQQALASIDKLTNKNLMAIQNIDLDLKVNFYTLIALTTVVKLLEYVV
jgi:hypothetical protein